MAKFILHWEVDPAKTPEDPKERQQQWLQFQDIVVQQMKAGLISDWGANVGELNGYCITEATEIEVHTLTAMWEPFVKFNTRSVLTIEQVSEATKAMQV